MSNDKFVINGGKQLKGILKVQGSKNAALSVLAATLIADKKLLLKNIPEIEDVKSMVDIIQSVGAKIEWINPNEVIVDAKHLDPDTLNMQKVGHIRASIQIIGALATRFKKFTIATPGGDQIGARPLTAHLEGFKEMGFRVTSQEGNKLTIEKINKPRDEIVLTEFSPTATVNILLLASASSKPITIYCAGADYIVQETCWFLEKLGVSIQGIGTHTLTVTGNESLQNISYEIMPDPIEVGTFLCLAAATKSNITIKQVPFDFLRLELQKLKEIGVQFSTSNVQKSAHKHYILADIEVKPSANLKALYKLHNMPAPGLMPDILPPLAVLATQAQGTTLIHDWMYEGRQKYLKDLIKMGANIKILDPHRVVIIGPTPLYGKRITSYDIRAGATLLIAALTAEGESQINNIYQVDRGYEQIDKRLAGIGADIKRL